MTLALADPAPRYAVPLRVKDAALYRQVTTWAKATAGGVLETTGPLAGIAWDQKAWHAVYDDGTRTCCVAGATVLLAGGVFGHEVATCARPGHQYKACLIPGTTWMEDMPVAASMLLGIDPGESWTVFAPNRTLEQLLAMVPAFETNTPVDAGMLAPSVTTLSAARKSLAALRGTRR